MKKIKLMIPLKAKKLFTLVYQFLFQFFKTLLEALYLMFLVSVIYVIWSTKPLVKEEIAEVLALLIINLLCWSSVFLWVITLF